MILLILLPFLGLIYYLLVNYQLYKDFFYFQKVQQQIWDNSFSLLGGVPRAIGFINYLDFFMSFALGYSQIAALIFFVLIIIYGFKKVAWEYFIYMLGVFCLSYPTSFWRSMPRFILVAWPAFLILALAIKKNTWLQFIVYLIFIGLWIVYCAVALSDYPIS